MTGPFNQEFVNKDLSYTVSSVSANVAEDFSVTLELGAAKGEEVVAPVSFTIPLTGNTIVATAAAMATCSSPANCTDSLTSTCSGSVCIAMLCGVGSFNPDGAYDSREGSCTDADWTCRLLNVARICGTFGEADADLDRRQRPRGGVGTVPHNTLIDPASSHILTHR